MNTINACSHGLIESFGLSDLIEKVQKLEKRQEVLCFVDYDGTLVDTDKSRLACDPKIMDYRGDRAYEYIKNSYGSASDPEGFHTFIEKMHPENFIFGNIEHIYQLNDDHYVILTAGNREFQITKIKKSGLFKEECICVNNADTKPMAMMEYILKLGYLPRKIRFFDDRIQNFSNLHKELSDALGIPVIFYQIEKDPDIEKQIRIIPVRVNKILSEETAF